MVTFWLITYGKVSSHKTAITTARLTHTTLVSGVLVTVTKIKARWRVILVIWAFFGHNVKRKCSMHEISSKALAVNWRDHGVRLKKKKLHYS